jgi:hypothetical protein
MHSSDVPEELESLSNLLNVSLIFRVDAHLILY